MESLLTSLSALCAVGPMLMFLAGVWWLDRYDREPVVVLVLVFSWSATAGALIAMAGNAGLGALLPDLPPMLDEAVRSVVIAPIVEEIAKALPLVAVLLTGHLDEATDGFVYGAAAGLGFAMTENFLYFSGAVPDGVELWAGVVVVRTFFSAVMHGLAAAAVGALVGATWFSGGLIRAAALVGGLALAMTIHATWNGFIMADAALDAEGALFSIDRVVLIGELIAWFVLFELSLAHEARTLQRELESEAALGTIPEDHPAILASWWRRLGTAWLPPGCPHDAYVFAATRLALARRMSRVTAGARRALAHAEVDARRAELQRLLRGL